MREISWLIVKKTRRLCWIQYPHEKGYIISWDEGHTKGLDHSNEITHYETTRIEIWIPYYLLETWATPLEDMSLDIVGIELKRWKGMNLWRDRKSRRLMRISTYEGVIFEDRMYRKTGRDWKLVT